MIMNGHTGSGDVGASDLYKKMAAECYVVDEESIRRPVKTVGLEIGDSGAVVVPAFGSKFKAKILDPAIRERQEKMAGTAAEAAPVQPPPVGEKKKGGGGRSSNRESQKPVPVREDVEDLPRQTRPRPAKKVEFVGDIADLEVMCHEVTFDPGSGFLSILADSSQKFKFTPEQRVVIRHDGREGFYWFTGISIPITVIDATLMVFGVVSEQTDPPQ